MYGSTYYGSTGNDGTSPAPAIQKIEVLTDNFDDNSLDASKWSTVVTGGGSIQETNSRIEMSLPSSANDGDLNDLSSVDLYTLEASSMSIKVVEVPNVASQANADFLWNLTQDGQNWIRWVIEGGIMYAQYKVGGYRTNIGTMSYTTDMLYWRIRESGGYIYFETSSDGASFTTHFNWVWISTFDTLDGGIVDMEFYAWQPETDPGQYIIDDFNILRTSITMPSIEFDSDSNITVVSPYVNVAVSNPLPRTYEYKVFDSSGNYIGSWPDVVSDFDLAQDINTAGSGLQVTLGRSIDTPFNDPVNLTTEASEHILTEAGEELQGDYNSPNRVGEGTDVAVGNRVEIWEYYGSIDSLITSDTGEEIVVTGSGENIAVHYGAPNGTLKFQGPIQEWEADYGDTDEVVVSLVSDGRQLDNYVLKDGETTTVPFFSQDPAAITRAGLNNMQAQGGRISYSPSSIRDTGNITTYTFRLNTFLEMVKKNVQLAPSDWFWYLDQAENHIYMQPRPTTVAHRFVLGEHIIKAKFRHSITNLVNLEYFMGGDKNNDVTNPDYLYKKYDNQPSITSYDQYLVRANDQRVTDEDTASIIANSNIDYYKSPRYAGTIQITSFTYPIETVRLGDLIGFANFGNIIDGLELIVASVRHTPDVLTATLEILPPKINKRIEDIKRNLNTQEQLNTPDTPT